MGSSRFPGKPLARLRGRPMLEHVFRRTRLCPELDGVLIATCDAEIAAAASAFGATAIMTSDTHVRASDRVAEAAHDLDADIIVMVQGDEPMIHPDMISRALEPFKVSPDVLCVNLAAPIATERQFEDRNTIKVVMAANGNALYFSREPIPTRQGTNFDALKAYKQVCVIPFRREFLMRYAQLAPTPLENLESIDMLRVLEHGYPVRLVECKASTQSVDTPADLARVEALLAKDPLLAEYDL